MYPFFGKCAWNTSLLHIRQLYICTPMCVNYAVKKKWDKAPCNHFAYFCRSKEFLTEATRLKNQQCALLTWGQPQVCLPSWPFQVPCWFSFSLLSFYHFYSESKTLTYLIISAKNIEKRFRLTESSRLWVNLNISPMEWMAELTTIKVLSIIAQSSKCKVGNEMTFH